MSKKTGPSPDLVAAIGADPVSSVVPSDKLEVLRDKARRVLHLDRSIADGERSVEELKADRLHLQRYELPDLLESAGVDVVGLPDDGYDATMTPYYYANIAADWDQDRRQAAFDWLEDAGHGDLIKTSYEVQFGRTEREEAKRLEKLLEENGFEFSSSLTVPWTTLTAFVREQFEKGDGDEIPLETIGATVGRIVKLKKRKEKSK